MRKLVTVRKVNEVRSIPDADAIECAVIDGWTVVIRKGEFTPGEWAVFFEVDSFIPASDERYSFLKNKITWDGKEGYRLKSVRLKKQLSQGLALPVIKFPEICNIIFSETFNPEIDNDFTSLLGVELWEAPIPAQLGGMVKGNFPSFIQKTDQERIQNLPYTLTEHTNSFFEVTVKLDGTSMTVFHKDGDVGVCGRNWQLEENDDNSLWKAAKKNNILDALKSLGMNIAIQGELVGEGIQGNPQKIKGQEFYIFDIWDINRQEYMSSVERLLTLTVLKGTHGAIIHRVPSLDAIRLGDFENLDALLTFADGMVKLGDVETPREGLVFKHIDNGMFSFKVISNKYLLRG